MEHSSSKSPATRQPIRRAAVASSCHGCRLLHATIHQSCPLRGHHGKDHPVRYILEQRRFVGACSQVSAAASARWGCGCGLTMQPRPTRGGTCPSQLGEGAGQAPHTPRGKQPGGLPLDGRISNTTGQQRTATTVCPSATSRRQAGAPGMEVRNMYSVLCSAPSSSS